MNIVNKERINVLQYLNHKLIILFILLLTFSCLHNNSADNLGTRGLFKQLCSSDKVLVVEDFTETGIKAKITDVNLDNIRNSCLHIDRDGSNLYFEDEQGFTTVVACYKLTSDTGHIFLSIQSADGHFALFNDASGDWAWKNFEEGAQKFSSPNFGQSGMGNTGRWMIHELRVEDKQLKYFVNHSLLGQVDFRKSGKMFNLSVNANIGGRGALDYLVILDSDDGSIKPPPGGGG